MRSIRRSLTLYLFALLAVTLGGVGVLIDQVTARSLAAREAAGGDLIRSRHDELCRQERDRTDKALLDQATALGSLLQAYYYTQYETELAKSRAAIGTVQLAFGPTPAGGNHLAQVGWTTYGNSFIFGRSNPHPWNLFRTYFANPPLPDEFINHIHAERAAGDFLQINTPSGREWHSQTLGGRLLHFDPKPVDGKAAEGKGEPRPDEPGKPSDTPNLIEWVVGDATTADGEEKVRRVLLSIPHFGRTPSIGGSRPPRPGPGRDGQPGPAFGGPQRSLVGAWSAWAIGGFGGPPPGGFGSVVLQPPPPPTPTYDTLPRLYIQCARPQASIDAALAKFAAERDEKLAQLAAEIHDARRSLRGQIAAVGGIAFVSLVVGAPLLVGRGLRPVGKLSDAVSRVSEKDFRLPHDGSDLSVELAPIHARLTQTLDQLRRAFSREKQAVADISHELRTPIAALLATIDVALRKPRPPEQYRATLEECRVISGQLSQLVERIMTLASLDAGNDRTLTGRTDAVELAAGCTAVIRPLAAANSVAVRLHADEVIELDTDPGKLREVLTNLLHNAVEYNRPGGSIDLTLRRVGGRVAFEVRDTGIGMTAEVRDKIFERFFRADPSRHATGVHAGLGLAIVKEYVARLGGTIEVESEPGVGSTFRVLLNALPGEEAPESPTDEPVGVGGTSRNS